MQLLKERILKDGTCLAGGIIRVDSFLNHQMDPALIHELGKEFARRFANESVTKVLTVEASGIAIAIMTGLELNVPVVFAKKAVSSNLGDDRFYSTTVHSFTKGVDCDLVVSKKYINENDKVLIIDDFLAMGEAASGLIRLVNQAGATLVGIGVAIEKAFQPGGSRLRERGLRVESLAIAELCEDGNIIFN